MKTLYVAVCVWRPLIVGDVVLAKRVTGFSKKHLGFHSVMILE
jgi:hypothetical protein